MLIFNFLQLMWYYVDVAYLKRVSIFGPPCTVCRQGRQFETASNYFTKFDRH